MITKTEIESLLYLMDDPDPFVQESVQSRFSELGERAVPLLDEFKMDQTEAEIRNKVNELIHQLTFNGLESDFLDLLEAGVKNRKDLEKAVLTLARFGNPTLRIRDYSAKLDRFAEIVESSIRYRLDERRKMKHLLKFVFEDLKFQGDLKDYHNPANCFMDQVIDRRKGLPISLSLVTMFIARRLDMPFFGVNMPVHFMLNFLGDKEEVLVDPFDKGAIVSYDQCYFFLKKNNIVPKPEHFQMASDLDILIRCIRNLIQSYEQLEQPGRVHDLNKLLAAAELFEK